MTRMPSPIALSSLLADNKDDLILLALPLGHVCARTPANLRGCRFSYSCFPARI